MGEARDPRRPAENLRLFLPTTSASAYIHVHTAVDDTYKIQINNVTQSVRLPINRAESYDRSCYRREHAYLTGRYGTYLLVLYSYVHPLVRAGVYAGDANMYTWYTIRVTLKKP